jgi:hypothetical protein
VALDAGFQIVMQLRQGSRAPKLKLYRLSQPPQIWSTD